MAQAPARHSARYATPSLPLQGCLLPAARPKQCPAAIGLEHREPSPPEIRVPASCPDPPLAAAAAVRPPTAAAEAAPSDPRPKQVLLFLACRHWSTAGNRPAIGNCPSGQPYALPAVVSCAACRPSGVDVRQNRI